MKESVQIPGTVGLGPTQEDPEIEKVSILLLRVKGTIFRILQVPVGLDHTVDNNNNNSLISSLALLPLWAIQLKEC